MGSIQTAAIMSKESQRRLMELTTSTAERLIIQALDNPVEYKALLVGPRAGTAERERAGRILERALLQSEVTGVRMLAFDAAQQDTEE